jgi:hypothetical protein
MKYRVWLLGTSAIWAAFWISDLIQVTNNSSEETRWAFAQISIVVGGMIAEVLSWRLARLINVGYFFTYGSWTLVNVVILDHQRLAPSGELAMTLGLFALPMILQGVINFIVYRRRAETGEALISRGSNGAPL